MRILIITVLALAPLAAFAADYSDAPLIVVNSQAAQVAPAEAVPTTGPVKATSQPSQPGAATTYTPDFPEWAVTKVGENSAGNTNPVPDSPASPADAPQAPQAVAAAAPAAPTSPASPASPINKLWPIDTIPIFMKSCMGFHVELAAPCKCVITNLMVEIPHDEFLKLTAAGSIEQDTRLASIRYRCVGTPAQQE